MNRWRKFVLIFAVCAVPATAFAQTQLADSCGCSIGTPCKCGSACPCSSGAR